MNCPCCAFPAIPRSKSEVVRHGSRAVFVRKLYWMCPGSCSDENGVRPYTFCDEELTEVNRTAVQLAWMSTYGEVYPGRPVSAVVHAPVGTVLRRAKPDDPHPMMLDAWDASDEPS